MVVTTPGLAETLQRDWQKAVRFFARFGITEIQFLHGVPSPAGSLADDPIWVAPGGPVASLAETRARAKTVFSP